MESAALGRAASVRIGAESVPVKVRFKHKSRKKRKNERGGAPKKNAASAGALRRVEQKNKGDAAICQQSELWRLFRRCVGGFAVTVKPFARGFGNPVAQYITRSEEHTSELQSLMRISYAVFCLKKKKESNKP